MSDGMERIGRVFAAATAWDFEPTDEGVRRFMDRQAQAFADALADHDRKVARKAARKAWDEGVETTLNHAIRNPDGITLRLEHLDGTPWPNPYEPKEAPDA